MQSLKDSAERIEKQMKARQAAQAVAPNAPAGATR